MTHELTEGAIIAYAAREGVKVTPEQLKRWRKAAVFPHPSRHGLGRGRGSRSLYPEGAERWAVDLARELTKKRDLPVAAWHLWLRGYPLTDHARQHIAEGLPQLIAGFDRWEKGELDLKSSIAKRGRKHPVLSAGARMLAGRPSTEDDLGKTWQHLPVQMRGPEAAPPRDWLSELKATGQGLSLSEWGAALDLVPDATLEQVRNEVLLIRLALDALGEGESSTPAPIDVLLWLGLTRVAPGGKTFVAFIRSAFEEGRIPELISQLREVLPLIHSARAMNDKLLRGRQRRNA